MKVQCEVCEKAEGEVLCCADEAVLCSGCDEKVHAANKLSQKHRRVSLLRHPPAVAASSPSSSTLPLCDICLEKNGFFFCLEDRAILCLHCDMSTHMASPYLSSHQRLLIGGIKVALESSTSNKTDRTVLNQGNYQRLAFSNSSLSDLPTGEGSSAAINYQDVETNMGETTTISSEADNLASAASWPLDDILGTNDFNYYEFSDMESSRITEP